MQCGCKCNETNWERKGGRPCIEKKKKKKIERKKKGNRDKKTREQMGINVCFAFGPRICRLASLPLVVFGLFGVKANLKEGNDSADLVLLLSSAVSAVVLIGSPGSVGH